MAADPPRKVADATRGLAFRKRALRRRRLIRVGLLATTLAVVGAIVWLIGFSPAFAVRTVVVTGTSVLTRAQVEQAAAVPMGLPLIRVDVEAIEARVRELPPVANVSVSRGLPGTVTVAVTERTPVYAMSAGSMFSLVDGSGVVFAQTDEVPDGLIGATLSPNTDRLRLDVATVVKALPGSIREQAVLVTASTSDNITIELAGGARLIWGSAEESPLKAQVADALVKIPASVYDVSSPSHPTTQK